MHCGWPENNHEAHYVPVEQMKVFELKENFKRCQDHHSDEIFILW